MCAAPPGPTGGCSAPFHRPVDSDRPSSGVGGALGARVGFSEFPLHRLWRLERWWGRADGVGAPPHRLSTRKVVLTDSVFGVMQAPRWHQIAHRSSPGHLKRMARAGGAAGSARAVLYSICPHPRHLRPVALAPDRTPEPPARSRGACGRREPGLCQRAFRGEAARARTRACFAG